jgi:hypothetical protein
VTPQIRAGLSGVDEAGAPGGTAATPAATTRHATADLAEKSMVCILGGG